VHGIGMGLKKTSEVVAISFSLNESAQNTFTQEEVNLSLSPLDQEVFVVVAVDLDPSAPSTVPSARTQSLATVTKSSQTSYKNLGSSNTIATAKRETIADAAMAVSYQQSALDTPVAQAEYIDVIATDNFYVAIQGVNNTQTMSINGRLWGYRARADGATYSALLAGEQLSA